MGIDELANVPVRLLSSDVALVDGWYVHQAAEGGKDRVMGTAMTPKREPDCHVAWVGTERSNTAARRLYAAAGGVEEPEDFVVEFDLGEAE